MSTFTLDAPVHVRPYAVRVNGPDAVIGDTSRNVYLTIPVEGLDLLEALAAGSTVDESVRRFEEKHDYSPDVEDFLELLAGEGFVAPGSAPAAHSHGKDKSWQVWNLEWLSPQAARRLLSWPVWVAGLALAAIALWCAIDDPGVLPGVHSITFSNPAYLWGLFLAGVVGIYIHELGHVVGARAAGMSATLKIGNQMTVMVAESDLSAMWLASKRQRYIALVVGPFIDLVIAAALLVLIWMDRHGSVALAEPVRIMAYAVVMSYAIRLQWQIFAFLRTDFYYVVATALGAPSLMADTRAYMRNMYRRLRKRPLIDQEGLTRRERRAIRIFVPFWLFGRVWQATITFGVAVPTIWFYLMRVIGYFTGEQNGYSLFDVLSFFTLIALVEGGGIVLWVVQLYRARRIRKQAPNRVYVE